MSVEAAHPTRLPNERQTILLVDDSENDRMLMRAAFKTVKCDSPLHEVRNGEEAVAYLKGEGPYSDRNKWPLPTVMLLDLNMPMMSGFDLVAWVRAQPVLKRLTIIILTASARSEDVERAFDCGATSYLVKPSNLESLVTMMRRLCDWIQVNQFPSIVDAGSS